MIDSHVTNPKSIKFHIKKYLDEISSELKGKTVIDFPAGNGASSEILHHHGASPLPFDLFPEYFMVDGLQCNRADIMHGIPVADATADMVICQEGMEHFSDQLRSFKEFNRVLKDRGELVITTPSYSNLAAKLSYMLFESETTKLMPPNEIDDIWMSDKAISRELYHGHIFLLGLQKLRVLGKLSGFRIKETRYVRLSRGSLFLLPLLYPFIVASSFMTYRRHMGKDKKLSLESKKSVYQEQFLLNVNIKNLLSRHTFIIYEKEENIADLDFRNEGLIKTFDRIM